MRAGVTSFLFIFCQFVFLLHGFTQTSGSKNISITLPSVVLVDVEPAGTINMSFSAPLEAGLPLTNPAPNTTKWLNYTSAVATGGSRTISAKVSELIPGVNIKLKASVASGAGGGTRGTPGAEIILTTSPSVFISGIGGAYTGTGANNGHQLTITLVPNNYANLTSQNNKQITITYTISGT